MEPLNVGLEGVYQRFPKVRSYLNSYDRGTHIFIHDELQRLQRYLVDPGFEYFFSELARDRPHRYDAYSASFDLGSIAAVKRWSAIQAALRGQPGWFEVWRESVAYELWHRRMQLALAEEAYGEYIAGTRHSLWTLFLAPLGVLIGNCLALGWIDQAVAVSRGARAAMCRDAIRPGLVFNDADDSFGRRRTQHFMLRLMADWRQWSAPDRPRCAFDEPLFNTLIDRWRSPDLEEVARLLIAACNRHTHQCRIDSFNNNRFYDLHERGWWYDPFEILGILRLRDEEGIGNPSLEHPLLMTPLGVLAPKTPLYSDPLLKAVLAQAGRKLPGLDRELREEPTGIDESA